MQMFPPPRPVEVYNPALRTLHWLMALVIFGALGLGVWATQLPRGDLRSEVLFVHKSLGVAVARADRPARSRSPRCRRARLCGSARAARRRCGRSAPPPAVRL